MRRISSSPLAWLVFVIAGALGTPLCLAAPEHLATIEQECLTQLGYGPERCACFGETAASQLSDKEQAFVAAQVTQDQAAIAQIQGTMTVNEMMAAGQFMTSAAQQCP
jgi:hypothetical protein